MVPGGRRWYAARRISRATMSALGLDGAGTYPDYPECRGYIVIAIVDECRRFVGEQRSVGGADQGKQIGREPRPGE